jgi:hypothetical protein
MAKRKTIGKDPLADLSTRPYAAEAVAAAIAAAPVDAPSHRTEEAPSPIDEPAPLITPGCGRRAAGGRLEILAGSFGSGVGVIRRFGHSAGIGFTAPTGRLVDFGAELEAVLAWPDRGDHRLLGAVGWAWVLGSLGGVIGLVAGSGLRLLMPRRMIARVRLRDGSEFLVRTDNATVTELEAVARARALCQVARVPA